MAEIQECAIYRGDVTKLVFTGRSNGSVAGWTTELNLFENEYDAAAALTVQGLVEDAGSVSTPGVFSVTISKAESLTLKPKRYFFSLKRVDVGSEKTVAEGGIWVRPDRKNALA